jgi:ABC-2 type transport system permease protein
MRAWIAFWSILRKDMATYYLKPPNLSWGIIFPLAWTLMFFIKSQSAVDLRAILPGVSAMSILFGTTAMLAVTVTFERRGRSFDRLLQAPISLKLLMLAKTSGAVIFGLVNAFVPILMAGALVDLRGIAWWVVIPGILFIATSSTFLGLFIAVSVKEVFEAQTFSNFFRFPMVFLCGLFLPIEQLPAALRPLAYALPLTYGADTLHGGMVGRSAMPLTLDFVALALFCAGLFFISLRMLQKKWIL